MNKEAEYSYIIVESYEAEKTSGKHGLVHVRPISGQEPFLLSMNVECSKDLKNRKIHDVGTKFRIKAKLISRLGGPLFVYTNHSWAYTVLES